MPRDEPDEIGGYGGGMGIAVWRAFIAACRKQAPPLFVPEDAPRVLDVLDAARESVRSGKTVALHASNDD